MKIKKIKFDSYSGFYRGIVLNNSDPDELGRVKVNIYGVYDGIDSKDLPWAVPASSMFSGAGLDYGSFCVPDVGSYVFCFFESSDLYQPVYFAEALDGIHGLPSERTTNYPYRKVWKTKNGIVIFIDDQDKKISITHPGNASIVIDSNGNIAISGTTVNINP